MAKVDWDSFSDFERHPKLDAMKVGDKITGIFEDDGNFVSKDVLKEAGAKHPRDSIVLVMTVDGEKKEFWVSSKAFSQLRQLKRLKEENAGTLKGLKVVIERVSKATDETNYDFKKA